MIANFISPRLNEAVATSFRPMCRSVRCAAERATPDQVQALWDGAVEALGGVDHWINNAGIAQPLVPVWDLEPGTMEAVVRTDLLGVLYGARVAMRGMSSQPRETGHPAGAIWFMEGHGSDGSVRRGMSVYGAAKRALRYTAKALSVEARGTGVLVGGIAVGGSGVDVCVGAACVCRRSPSRWARSSPPASTSRVSRTPHA